MQERNAQRDDGQAIEIRSTANGYSIQGPGQSGMGANAARFASAALGGGLISAAGVTAMLTVGPMATGLSLAAAAAGLMALGFAVRAPKVEIEFDFVMGELREVVLGLSGRIEVMRRHAIDTVTDLGVIIDEAGSAMLVTLFGEAERPLVVAEGEAEAIARLKRKLSSDLGLQSGPPRGRRVARSVPVRVVKPARPARAAARASGGPSAELA